MKTYTIEEIETVAEELRNGKTIQEISTATGICRDNVNKIKKKLIEDKIITAEEIENARDERKKKEFLEDSITKDILKYVRAGLSQEDIANLVGRAQGVVSHKISLLKQYNVITEEEIVEAREKYMQEIKNDNFRREYVLESLRRGIPKNDIKDELGLTYNGVLYIQKSLIKDGMITQEDIDRAARQYKKDRPKNSKRSNKSKLNDSEIDEKILIGIKKGYSQQRIANEMFEKGEISQTGVGKRIARLIREGTITQKQIERYKKEKKEREERQKKKFQKAEAKKIAEEQITEKKELKELERSIIGLLLDGFTIEEIAEQLGYAKSTIGKKIAKLKKEGQIDQEKLNEARRKRRKKESEKVKKKRAKDKKEEEKQKKKLAKKEQDDKRQEELYRKNLKKAQKIQEDEDEATDEEINGLVRELISFAVTPLGKAKLNKEEIIIIEDTLFEARKMDIKNILGIAKLWILLKDYQESISILDYAKNFFEGEDDLEKIDNAIETVKIYKQKIQAAKLFIQGYSLDEVARKTKLNVADLIQVRNKTAPVGTNNEVVAHQVEEDVWTL